MNTPVPSSQTFFLADPETKSGGHPGAPIQSLTESGPAESVGVLPGWRVVKAQRGTKLKPEGDPVACTDSLRAQSLFDRWAMKPTPVLITFEGPDITITRHDATNSNPGDELDENGKQALLEVLRSGMELGAIPIMTIIQNAISVGAHWRHGVENYDEMQRLGEEIESYYKIGATEGPPERNKHLCWGLSGVPDELQDINNAAKTHEFISRGGQAEKVEEEPEQTGPKKSPLRPRSSRPYDRLRRPLSPDRIERPPSPGTGDDARFPGYPDMDFVPDVDDGVTPVTGLTPVTSRPMSAVSRPISGVRRPESAASRPKSAVSRSSRPTSAATVQRMRPMSAVPTTETPLHVRIPTASQTRPASAPSGGKRSSWLYSKPSRTVVEPIVGPNGAIWLKPKKPAGPWTRKCRENGTEVLRHKLTSCLLMSRASPFE